MSNSSLPIDREELALRLRDLQSVRPLPTNALKLLNACKDPASNTAEIIGIIESEPAIAARVLAAANSPLYGYSRRIGTIGHAVVILGIRNITQLAISFAAKNMFCGKGDSGNEFCVDLYKHSLGCALVARNMAQIENVCDPDQAFLGGLLHDVGKLVLVQLLSGDYVDLTSERRSDNLLKHEKEILGFTHQEVGMMYAQKWGFPTEISNVIANHHGSESSPLILPLPMVVEAANYVAFSEGIGNEPPIGDETPDDEAENSVAGNYIHNQILTDLVPEMRTEVVESAQQEFEILTNAL